eukprot:Sdes_comp20912_c1_seq5m18192
MSKNPPEKKAKNPAKAVFAGGLAGGCEILITYPTEYVKTQLQLDERQAQRRFQGPISVVKQTWKERGVLGFYRGLSSQLYGAIPKSGVRFGAYDIGKRFLASEDGTLTHSNTLFCGFFAGTTEAIVIVCPMETVKIKFIHDMNSASPKYASFFHGVRLMIQEEGIRGVYRGILPTILKQGSNQAIRFLSYNQIKAFMLAGKSDGSTQLTIYQSLLAGGLAGACSVFGNTPIDVVKTRLQGLDAHKYRGTFDCVVKIWKNEGILA